MSYKDFSKVEYLPFGESVELMKNRQLDVTLQSAGLGVSALRDLATSVDIVVVRDSGRRHQEDQRPRLSAGHHPCRIRIVARPPTFLRLPCRTTSSPTTASATDTVYGMTKALWTSLDQLTAAHSAAKAIELKHALDGMPVPLHPGAEKYYKEVGVMK